MNKTPSEKSTTYVLTWIDKVIVIAGPFEPGHATAYGERWQAMNGDNPCWQVLSDGTSAGVQITHISAVNAELALELLA